LKLVLINVFITITIYPKKIIIMPSLAIQEILFIICLLIIPLLLINVFVFLFNQEIFKTTLIRSGKICLLLILIFTLIALIFNLFLQHNNVLVPLNSNR
jgi:hypothetical protein